MLELSIKKKLNGFLLDLRLEAPEDKTIVLFGPSGAGKSLTLGSIAGLVHPDAGRVAVGSLVLFDPAHGIDLPPQRRRIGLVKQDLALFPHLTVEQNVMFGLHREPRERAGERARELLRVMNLDGVESKRPAELSGGQQQRVALARALAIRPNLLLLDEPFSALDLPTRMQLREQVKSVQKQLHPTVLFVTHDLGEAYQLADYMAVVAGGRVLQFDVPDRVLNAPASRRVAEIVRMKNILDGVLVSDGRVRIGERVLDAPTAGLVQGARVAVCVRPERVTLVRRHRQPDDLPNVMEGNLIADESDGSNVILQFRAQGPRLRPGQPYDLEIDTPVYVYERLDLVSERHWTISIKPGLMHVIEEEGPR